MAEEKLNGNGVWQKPIVHLFFSVLAGLIVAFGGANYKAGLDRGVKAEDKLDEIRHELHAIALRQERFETLVNSHLKQLDKTQSELSKLLERMKERR